MSPQNSDSQSVTGSYNWGTSCLIMSNGRPIATAYGYKTAGTPCEGSWSSGLSTSGSSYRVNSACGGAWWGRILLRRPCAAGGFQGATMATRAEASTATCTMCGAGRYSSATGASSSATCASCTAGTYSSAGAGERDCGFLCVFVFVRVCRQTLAWTAPRAATRKCKVCSPFLRNPYTYIT